VSFILDALRKSESERQLDAVPQVMRVPLAVESHRLPLWAGMVMVMLSAGLIAVGAVWWTDRQTPATGEPAAEIARVPVEQDQDAAAGAHADTGTPSVAPTLDVPTGPGREPATERVTPESGVEDAAPAASSAATNAAAVATLESESYLGLPSVVDLIAEGIAVPRLELQLLVNSSDAASRFVLINGNRYLTGDRLSEGPEVMSINADGAVLRYAERDFLLIAN